jgi:RecA/RadA recombinase
MKMQKEQIMSNKETSSENMVAGLDINKLIKKTQDTYDKSEIGLSKLLSTGKNISRPVEDKDFIVWPYNSLWSELTGLKGIPLGYIVQISGKPDSGKSSMAACFMKAAQDQDFLIILWDSEKKFSAARFDHKMNGDSSKLVVINTNNIIDGCNMIAKVVHSAKELNYNTKILICWDSVGASLNTSEDNEEENYSLQPGVSAKQNSYAIKKFNKLANKYKNKDNGDPTISTLVINQVYQSIGIGAPTQIEKGGTEIYYLSSIIIQLSRKQDLIRTKEGKKLKFGIISRAKVKKNHLFDGNENIAELDIVVSAEGIQLASEVKSYKDVSGWTDSGEDE